MVIESSQLLGQSLGTCAIQRLIGRGGMGAVYLAQQIRPRREVAVKVFMPALLLDSGQRAEFLARFRREADAVAALDHINIVPLYEYGEQNELAYLVMPYVTGGTLRERLERRGILPLNEVLIIIEQAAAALDYAHEQGIIHRDLKPGNILFHADGRVLLADFGLAKIVNETTESIQEASSGITSAGTIIGTPEYFSPEQSTGNLVDRRTDVYSLGIVLYQMLSGHVPFTGATPVAIAVKHTTEEPPSLLHYNAAVPHGVEAVIMKAIAKKPDQRYNSAGELAHALRVAIPGLPPSSSEATHAQNRADRLLPVILASNDTVAEMPLVATSEAQTVQTPLNYQPPQTAQTPEPQKILQTASQNRVQPDMMLISPQPRLKKRDAAQRTWLLLITGMLVLVLLIGGSLSYLHFSAGGSASTQGATSQTSPSATETTVARANSHPLLAVGTLLFSATRPACNTQHNLWSKTANAEFTCNQLAMELKNTATSHLAGIFLNNLPDGSAIPDDYILQVQISQSAGSFGSYGVFFRNQPGSQQGTYSFMLDPSGFWKAYTYDNVTGAASTLYGHQATVKLNGYTTIDIVVQRNT
ncbi:MAG TPA: protein kinase, partial [Ktedonobacteraceae bacterium]|nr:protein kinase [Ktedonobacteraceae bacterium]